jgi:PleD family two-component response regulator
MYRYPGASKLVNRNIDLRLKNEDISAQLNSSLARMERLAATDPMTGLPNRRSLQTSWRARMVKSSWSCCPRLR